MNANFAKFCVEVIDPAQSGRAVCERSNFETLKAAQSYVAKQESFDHWNRYEIISLDSGKRIN